MTGGAAERFFHEYSRASVCFVLFAQEYRSNDRVLTLAPATVMDALLQRLLVALRDEDALVCEPMGPDTGGVWIPVHLNECLKFGRYRGGAWRLHSLIR